MAYTPITTNPFTVPGSAAGFLDIRKRGATGPVVTVAVPAYAGSTTPLAPTNPAVDDTNNTFSADLVSGYATTSQYDYSVNGGTSYTTGGGNLSVAGSRLVLAIGNVARAVGQVVLRVAAANSNPAGTPVSNATAFTMTATGSALAAPQGVAASATSPTEAGVSWFKVTGNAGYVVEIARDAAFSVGFQTLTVPTDAVGAAFTGLRSDSDYLARVKALAPDPANNSAYSPAYSFRTPAPQANSYAYSWEFEGDSLSADVARGGYAGNWPRQVQQALDPAVHGGFFNYATAGESINGSMNSSDEITEVLSSKSSTAVNILGFLAGINDLQGGASAADAYGYYKALLNQYVGYGYRVIAVPLTNSRAPALGNQREFYQREQVFNNLMRAGFNDGSLQATVLIDLQTNPHLHGYDAPLDVTYFRPDYIHFNETGGTPIITEMVLRAVPYLTANTRKVITATGEVNTAPLMPVDIVVQDTDSAITYTGNFSRFTGGSPALYGGSFSYSQDANSAYAYTVPAGGYDTVVFEGYTDAGGATFDAFVNGQPVGSGTQNYPDAAARRYFVFTNVQAGDVLKLVRTGSSGLLIADQIVASKSV